MRRRTRDRKSLIYLKSRTEGGEEEGEIEKEEKGKARKVKKVKGKKKEREEGECKGEEEGGCSKSHEYLKSGMEWRGKREGMNEREEEGREDIGS